jgi:hypothetical protein
MKFFAVYVNKGARVAQSVYRLGYRLDGQVSVLERGDDGIFPLHHVQTGSEAHQPPIQ